ncbi:MAG: DUF6569 family protein [Candidatus Bathyarchaeia archaeon]
MKETIKKYLEEAKVGEVESFKNLAMWPITSNYSTSLEYLTLDEALSENQIEVMEVVQGGTVSELKVINKSPHMLMILDGEGLVGAKQNRVLNTTILVGGKSTIVIPVSCVEQGRWSYVSRRFNSKGRIMSSNLRAIKSLQVHESLRMSGNYRSNQGEIWDEIQAKAIRMKALSPTMAMSRIYEKESGTLEEYTEHFHPMEDQVGALFMINGVVAGLDAFGRGGTFSRVFKKLLQSYALDAIDWFDPEKKVEPQEGEVTEFVKSVLSARVEARPSVGLGTDCRLKSDKLTGFALIFDDQVLHLSVFPKPGNRSPKDRFKRMESYSRRRIRDDARIR